MNRSRLLAAAILAAATLPAFAGACRADDAWRGRDKTAHLLAGAAIGAAGTAATGSAWRGLGLGLAVAAAKEAADSQTPRAHCTLQDFLATAAGAAIGAPAGLLLIPARDGLAVAWSTRF